MNYQTGPEEEQQAQQQQQQHNYNYNYGSNSNDNDNNNFNYYSQPAVQPSQFPTFTTSPPSQFSFSGNINPPAANINNNNNFDNVDISRADSSGNRFSGGTPFETVHEYFSVSNKKFQNFLDSTTPHTGPRWLMFCFLLFVFILRIVLYQGFYVVAYALGIYLLNIFLLFLSPKFDPAMTEDESGLDNEAALYADDGDFLPGNATGTPLLDEFRPFVRRLPEFKFWYNATSALCIGLACTLFSFFDIPVFWPILLMYFVILFALTMRRQIQHMVKYKYLPFDLGKKAYA